jgi:hypothetical protein
MPHLPAVLRPLQEVHAAQVVAEGVYLQLHLVWQGQAEVVEIYPGLVWPPRDVGEDDVSHGVGGQGAGPDPAVGQQGRQGGHQRVAHERAHQGGRGAVEEAVHQLRKVQEQLCLRNY